MPVSKNRPKPGKTNRLPAKPPTPALLGRTGYTGPRKSLQGMEEIRVGTGAGSSALIERKRALLRDVLAEDDQGLLKTLSREER